MSKYGPTLVGHPTNYMQYTELYTPGSNLLSGHWQVAVPSTLRQVLALVQGSTMSQMSLVASQVSPNVPLTHLATNKQQTQKE